MNIEKIIKTLLPYIIVIIIVVLLKMFVITTIRVNGTSMVPTLENGDIMLLDRITHHFNKIKRFDVVVINRPGEDVIKRIIGLPGETLKYVDNVLYINDQVVEENFQHKKTKDFNIESIGAIIIPENSYFVVGDNRGDSYDSRYYGFISKNDILGRASLTIYPFNRLGVKK